MPEAVGIAGFAKLSLVDWPGKVVSSVFFRGCNFRCPWCHNPDLVDPNRYTDVSPAEDVLAYLVRRRDVLDGVVVTGGEAVLTPGLPAFLEAISRIGLPVQLDTNGSSPDKLFRLLESGLVQSISVDYKVPFRLYPKVVGGLSPDAVRRTIVSVLERGCGEVRTTIVPNLHTPELLSEMASAIPGLTRGLWRLQPFRPGTCLDATYNDLAPTDPEHLAWLKRELEFRGETLLKF
ncbi:MAG: anaerobic ribonucleoside-triphosphate reductase activating protein [Candidatus Desulforudaceae bacterium]|nr:anaerobic ribonucleoside-triphosphate reductase activating protein [Eubacteriales bacterium]